jgi:hypothetical protein
VTVRKRGRSRKHRWVELQNIEDNSSPEALYLRWASVNNPALAHCGQFGCPRCDKKRFRLRHDKKFNNIRFYCSECGFETSFHIIRPKKSLKSIEIHDTRGVLVGVKNVDDHHGKTSRENSDALVLYAERKPDLGGEWFDGLSGTNSQSRYLTREEILKRIENRRARKLMEDALAEIDREEREYQVSAIEAEFHEDNIAD